LSVVIWIFIVGWAVAFPEDTRKFGGGCNALSALRCLWETLVCVGMSYLLIMVFQRHFNRQGAAARCLSANAFAVYLFHPPILIACAIMLHGVTAPGPVKAGLLTLVSAVAAFTLCELVMRRIPYLREIL
jgi:surface polysaccharide O-acyltransferase-like enzyme